MAKRNLEESSLRNSGCILLLLLLVCPPSSVASPPALLSLLIPWNQGGPWKQAALQPIGEAPPILSREDTNRQMINSFLENGGRKMFSEQMGEDWESPRDPDLFLLTEVNDGDSGERSYAEEMEARRVKRTGSMQVGGSRMRTSVGGGLLGAGNGRGSMNGGRMGGPVGGGIAGGPSLSIVNPLDVLRQRLLLEIARRRMRQSEDQILANRELLKSIGKREATSKKATSM